MNSERELGWSQRQVQGVNVSPCFLCETMPVLIFDSEPALAPNIATFQFACRDCKCRGARSIIVNREIDMREHRGLPDALAKWNDMQEAFAARAAYKEAIAIGEAAASSAGQRGRL